jgi:hypothetical protein
MTRTQRRVRLSWLFAIRRAIQLGDANAARRLTIGLVHRLRELGVVI